jgi:release factor glutamine methyltransferase
MSAWTIQKILPVAQDYLANKVLGTAARLEAELLLAHVLACDRVYLFTHFERPLQEHELAAYRVLLKRRAAHEPVAYILGRREFMSLKFLVNPSVLIPRPETELMVEAALAHLELMGGGSVCDVGTGSGAVAISVGHYANVPVTVTGLDISPEALAVARSNGESLKVEVDWQMSDLLQAVAPGRSFAVITANLPYVGTEEIFNLPREVRQYEPEVALVTAGADGMDLYRRLTREAVAHLSRESVLLMEICPHHVELLPEVLGEAYEWQVYKDLTGRDRLVKARLL